MSERNQRAALRRAVATFGVSLVAAAVAAVTCAMLAPGSLEVRTGLGDLPVSPQDEMRVAAEVWFVLAMAVLAVLTTVLWWRRSVWRGPLGLGLSAAAAAVQTGVALLVWRGVVAIRGFDDPVAVGAQHVRAPVLSSSASLWTAAIAATLTYLVFTIMAAPSDLARTRPARECEAGNAGTGPNLEG